MKGPDSRRLVAYVLLIAVASLVVNDLARRGLVAPIVGFGAVGALFLGNLAVAVAGLRTPQRIAWAGYLILSVAIFVLLGFSNPVSAAILLVPFGLEFVREALRPS